jgi:hypothetical protein
MLSEKGKAGDHGFQIHFAGRYQLKCALIDVGVAKHRLNSDFLGYRRWNVEANLFHRQPHQYDGAAPSLSILRSMSSAISQPF